MADAQSLPPQVQQQLQTLQALNQQMQATAAQRGQYEAMKAESEQALAALESLAADAPVYRSVGAFLVKEPSKQVAVDRLKEDLETMELRLNRMQKQEQQLREQMGQLQAKLQAALKP